MAIIRREEPGLVPKMWEPFREPFRMMRELMRWDPFAEMERYWPERFSPYREFTPAFDIKETKELFVLRADLPGIREEELEVSVTGNRLTVSGKREEEERREGERFFTYERAFGAFSRSFTLPEGADTEHISAELKGGVLTLTVPKRPEVQPKRISVRKAEAAKA